MSKEFFFSILRISLTLTGSFSQKDPITSRSLCNYYGDEIDGVDDNTSAGKSFEYKTKVAGKTPERAGNEGDANRPSVTALIVEFTIPLRYLSNFWGFLNLPLIM